MTILHLSDRTVFEVSGPDALALLQGQLTQDMDALPVGSAAHGAMLTPQGKYLFDALVFRAGDDTFLLDTMQAEAFARRLTLFRLRAKVTIQARPDLAVLALTQGAQAPSDAVISVPDPRASELPARALVPVEAVPAGAQGPEAWRALRLELGVPELAEDLIAEKDFALEGLLDELAGVDFHKGCYVGQEMTSRMKRRTTVRTKLCRVRYAGAAPAPGTAIIADGWEVGQMRSGIEAVGIALIRFDRALAALAKGEALLAGETQIRLDPPGWLVLPEGSEGGSA